MVGFFVVIATVDVVVGVVLPVVVDLTVVEVVTVMRGLLVIGTKGNLDGRKL